MGHTCKLTSGANYVGITLKSGVMHVHVYKVISTTKLSPRCWAVESLTCTQLSAVTIPSLAYLAWHTCAHTAFKLSHVCYTYTWLFDIFLSYLCLTQIRPRTYYCYQYFRYIQHFCMPTHTCIYALTTHEGYDPSKDSYTKRRYSLETSIG